MIIGLKLRIDKNIRGKKYWLRIMLRFGISDNKNNFPNVIPVHT